MSDEETQVVANIPEIPDKAPEVEEGQERAWDEFPRNNFADEVIGENVMVLGCRAWDSQEFQGTRFAVILFAFCDGEGVPDKDRGYQTFGTSTQAIVDKVESAFLEGGGGALTGQAQIALGKKYARWFQLDHVQTVEA